MSIPKFFETSCFWKTLFASLTQIGVFLCFIFLQHRVLEQYIPRSLLAFHRIIPGSSWLIRFRWDISQNLLKLFFIFGFYVRKLIRCSANIEYICLYFTIFSRIIRSFAIYFVDALATLLLHSLRMAFGQILCRYTMRRYNWLPGWKAWKWL